ncbi:MAG TPA: DUF1345 domain-containing protein [Pseudolabrys sp.]|jgi:uncharacterized membrane protein|nr:DUF1345 domain-containing protein [Pseudolabrys sp.]
MAKTARLPEPLPPFAIRFARLHAKLLIAAAVGALAALAEPFQWHVWTRVLVGWNVGLAFYLITTHTMMLRADEARIRKRAAELDEGAFVILVLTVIATLASLVAIVFELGTTKPGPHASALAPALLAMVTIVMSWSFVHTIFALHYAHEYYGERRDGRIGGLSFPEDQHPLYWDFLYFSLVIGMTSQVSDVAITSKVIRRMATVHGVVSFFFNLTVLALTVNLVSNFVQAALGSG